MTQQQIQTIDSLDYDFGVEDIFEDDETVSTVVVYLKHTGSRIIERDGSIVEEDRS